MSAWQRNRAEHQNRVDRVMVTAAWDSLFTGWLPQSGYQPAGQSCFERYRGD